MKISKSNNSPLGQKARQSHVRFTALHNHLAATQGFVVFTVASWTSNPWPKPINLYGTENLIAISTNRDGNIDNNDVPVPSSPSGRTRGLVRIASYTTDDMDISTFRGLLSISYIFLEPTCSARPL